MTNPPGTPRALATSVDVQLTLIDTPIISRNPGSSDPRSSMAERKLSVRKLITWRRPWGEAL
jgi:hypothetical protein